MATDKLAEIRNKIARTILMVLGTVLSFSVFWRHIMEGFGLRDTPVPWTSKDWILLGISFFLMLGAAYFNTLIKFLIGTLKKKVGN